MGYLFQRAFGQDTGDSSDKADNHTNAVHTPSLITSRRATDTERSSYPRASDCVDDPRADDARASVVSHTGSLIHRALGHPTGEATRDLPRAPLLTYVNSLVQRA